VSTECSAAKTIQFDVAAEKQDVIDGRKGMLWRGKKRSETNSFEREESSVRRNYLTCKKSEKFSDMRKPPPPLTVISKNILLASNLINVGVIKSKKENVHFHKICFIFRLISFSPFFWGSG
jgi:hypothetical protein